MSTLLYLSSRLVVVMLWNRRQRLILFVRIVCSVCRRRRLFIVCRRCCQRSRHFWWRRRRLCRGFIIRNIEIVQCRIFWNCKTELQICLLVLVLVHPAYFSFLARNSMLSALYAIARPSVCPSVTRVDQSKTVELRVMQFSPYSSPIPLVFAG